MTTPKDILEQAAADSRKLIDMATEYTEKMATKHLDMIGHPESMVKYWHDPITETNLEDNSPKVTGAENA